MTDPVEGSDTHSQDFGSGRASSLGRRAASGGRWGAIRTISLQLLTTLTTLVLARILVPADFGAVAAALVIVGMFDMLTQAGFGTALVRRVELDDRETTTVFWMAVGVGALATLLAGVFAAPLTALIGQPEATSLVILLAFTIPISLTRNIGRSLLLRELRFRAPALIEVTSLVLYAAVAIVLALWGFGPWAIVLGYLARGGFEAASLFVAARWRPGFDFERKFVAGELAFSGGILGQQVLNYFNKNIDYWVVGSVLGAASLGAYYVAFVIPELIRRRLNDIAREVLYPILSRIGEDKERARFAYLKVLRSIAFLSVPAMIGIASLSDLVIGVAFGNRWTAAAAPMAVLALASAVTSVSAPSSAIATAAGRPHLILPAQAAGIFALGLGLFITAPSGDLGTMSWSVVAGAVVTSVGLHIAIVRLVGLTVRKLLWELIPMTTSTAVMWIFLRLVKPGVASGVSPLIAAAVLVASGAFVYLAVFWLFFKGTLIDQLKSLRIVIKPEKQVL